MQGVQHFCVTFFIEVKFQSYHTESNSEGIDIEEIQNIKHMNIEIKIMNNTATVVFSNFYITARKSTGGQNVRSVRFQGFWSTIF